MNKGKFLGQQPPLKLHDIGSICIRLLVGNRIGGIVAARALATSQSDNDLHADDVVPNALESTAAVPALYWKALILVFLS